MHYEEVKKLKVDDKVVIQMTGCLGEYNAVVISEVGSDYHPGPWLRLIEDMPTSYITLKDGDYLIMRKFD